MKKTTLALGMHDKLFKRARTMYQIEHCICDLLMTKGFLRIETPTLEHFEVFSDVVNNGNYNFFDKNGDLISLRPDITSQIGRVIASTQVHTPIKFSYSGKVFNYNEEMRGLSNEHTQAGVEIISFPVHQALEEAVISAKEALDVAGVRNCKFEFSHAQLLQLIFEELNPFTVGGGIRSVEDMNKMLKAGADKVAVTSSAHANPQLIADCAQKFGNQCVVTAIDAKKMADGSWHVFVAGGRKDTGRDLIQWAQEVVALGAGEILLTSMDKDGTKSGFDLEMLNRVAEVVDVPIIASGGAGNIEGIVEVFEKTTATGALAASIFHFGEVNIGETKQVLAKTGIEVRQ